MMRFIAVGLLLTVAGGAAAYGEAAGYKCNIKHSLQLGKDGSAQPNALANQYRNMEFVIDRASGRMLGGTASNWKYEVWDRGSNQQSYKAVYTSQAGFLNVQLLQIREYENGPVKPFLLVDGTEVHTGTCTHLQ
jgi:hypothetical protein